ncbi:uncharacterized protein LOC131668317 [Phymastichus coffea]|uniref:uncharacterized protein LOC131668317 n=1 Tax=Phymastichus coffea TaxID=108790 RepID=UPI00273C2232|nr:uncharacterized protein LOC131668317 [Phymastichus coffea]
MTETYFGNLRKVGANVDEEITKLQDIWNMPHVLLCNNNEETQNIAKQVVENLKTDLKQLKDDIEESRKFIISLEEASTQELEEKIEEVTTLEKELEEIKVLFVENGYVEEAIESDFVDLNNRLKSLSSNNSSLFINDVSDLINSPLLENNCLNDFEIRESINSKTPIKNISYDNIRKPIPINEPPMEPIYSPCYYKIIKK